MSHPGLQETVERTCFDDWNTLRLTNSCGWLAKNAEGSRGCDVELPQILYGIVTKPSHKYVCVGRFSLDGTGSVVGARVLPMEDDGLVFTVAEPGESYHAHFLNGGGKRIGDPPLDAPSDPIYTMCEAQVAAERDGSTESVHNIDLIVTFDSELLEEDVTVVFHSGLDLARVSSSDADADGSLVVKVRTSPSVSQPTIEIEINSAPMLGDQLAWPSELQEILSSGQLCGGTTTVALDIGSNVLELGQQSFILHFVASECSTEDGNAGG